MIQQDIKIFTIIFWGVFLASVVSTWDIFHLKNEVQYSVEFVSATSTEPFEDYLNRKGAEGWEMWNYWDYSDGRKYLFKK